MSVDQRPLLVAHRGSSLAEPEHALAAYRLAIAEGADALECDVRLTHDGHLVLLHDRRISRVAHGRRVVSATRLEDLGRYDYSREHPRSGADDGPAAEAGTSTPDPRRSLVTLEQFLAEVAAHDVALSIETKHPTRHGGRLEKTLLDVLDRGGWLQPSRASRLRLMSFSVLALRRFRRGAPHVPAVYLVEHMPAWRRDGSLPNGARIAGPSIDIVRRDPGYVARVHDCGGAVHVWTVDADEDIDLCLSLNVDAIISNRPGYVRSRLG